MTNEFDVLIIGAGLSGIGAAYRVKTECPNQRFAVLEAREAIGGTWDVFRYPGVRSDSDMFTLGYPFHPWPERNAIAGGSAILDYVRDTAQKFGIDPLIRFRHRVVAAAWSSKGARWTLDVEVGEARAVQTFVCRFLYLCTGYYRYDAAHDPQFRDIERFRGTIAHPQWWPEQLDYTGKRVVVIGSGATAVTLVPAMAERAAHVTMLQRSPSYVVARRDRDPIADAVRAVLPASISHQVVRAKNAMFSVAFYQYCRRFPERASRWLRREAAKQLPPNYPVERHFTPRYNPWDQRMCLVPNADLFKVISSGKASVVTDTIDAFTETGIRTSSGEIVEADVIVTATGLQLIAYGGIAVSIDGVRREARDALVYKGMMLSDVPNFAWCVGYTNASWTLRADITSRSVCRLLNFMERRGYDQVVPRLPPGGVETSSVMGLSSGYIARSQGDLPKQGKQAPWFIRQNYLLDSIATRLARIDDPALAFSRAG